MSDIPTPAIVVLASQSSKTAKYRLRAAGLCGARKREK